VACFSAAPVSGIRSSLLSSGFKSGKAWHNAPIVTRLVEFLAAIERQASAI
jgi:hypothetical protein